MEGLFHGIAVGTKGLAISLLQFADDTMIMGKADSENIFMVKTILRWFELMFGLRINFSKSCVSSLKVSQRWIQGAASVLHCEVGKIPLMYLGMPIGGKNGSSKMWDPVINKFRVKLAAWKSAALSVSGRITLLNSRSFLWGGVELKRKIPWVKWDYVCTSKRKGGLGVSDLHRKNWALLGKWWFKLGDGAEGLWKQVVWEKYYGGREEVDITAVDTVQVSRIWKDVISIGLCSSSLKNMLVNGFKWEVGDGSRVHFWREVLVGDKPLRDLCPRLFELAVKKDGLVSEMGGWEEGCWRWNIAWRRGRLGREQDEELVLWETINRAQIKAGTDDCWHWVHGSDGKYVGAILVRNGDGVAECSGGSSRIFLVWIGAFKGNVVQRDDLVEMIQAKTFFWIKNYLQGYVFSLVDWKINPVETAADIRKNKSMLKEFCRNINGRKD
ncbi:hypothetical protein SLEP1_g41043 [Rubroshorea leprosula]|uniref:Reverse transcriptase domain-containing protein n=1 Tax=Rubroshorea leprosula TaxID=152421 RepID=A0AAV5L5E2_9ROSI|nr:hypothetical protein SLEP1_g41043 [Rubroshorea leprosula]